MMLIGVVGKANVGKSTFFKAATLAEVEIANYPFATIKPNHGTGYVRVDCAEKFFNVKCNPRFGYCIEGIRFVPVDMLDVAGLVPGAHEGKGMGNQFLDDLRQADALIHVVDVAGTTNEKGEPITPGSYDPADDIKFLEEELDYWYLGILKKGWEKFARDVQQTHKEVHKALAKQLSGLGVDEKMVERQIENIGLNRERPVEWTEDNLFALAKQLRKLTKPMVVACNKIDVPGAAENFTRIENEFPDHILIACSAESELALKEAAKNNLIRYTPGSSGFEVIAEEKLNERQKKALEFIKTDILNRYGSTGVQKILNDSVFKILKYIAIFPGGVNKLADQDGNILPDCFLIPPNSTALDFAYKIHSDLGDNFIRAIDVKTKKIVGKEYKLKNGDVVEIVTNK
ncbi:redox-regulated ATPase YchF [Candidatus Woesearchaeota archaeon]|nr:redox-regulated ATPase YchF [Candidatus Woesearchaeota archaeon]